MGAWVWTFAGGALAYACLSLLCIYLVARLLRFPLSLWMAPFLLLYVTFFFLTQYPFPVDLRCPVPTATPNLTPFAYWNIAVALWNAEAPPIDWARNRMIAATIMNFALCLFIGLAGVLGGMRAWTVVGLGLLLTLFAEFSQLTGLWGIFACPYRQFNIDDLMLNSAGTATGAFLGALVRRFLCKF